MPWAASQMNAALLTSPGPNDSVPTTIAPSAVAPTAPLVCDRAGSVGNPGRCPRSSNPPAAVQRKGWFTSLASYARPTTVEPSELTELASLPTMPAGWSSSTVPPVAVQRNVRRCPGLLNSIPATTDPSAETAVANPSEVQP